MSPSPRELYIELLRSSLTASIYPDQPLPIGLHWIRRGWVKRGLAKFLTATLKNAGATLGIKVRRTPEERDRGLFWPPLAYTMIGRKRMANLSFCVETVLKDGILGDLIETGVWRGGACILMRGILAAYDIPDRIVYVADSFHGLPKPNDAEYPQDAGDRHHENDYLIVPLEQVKENFERYGLLDSQVVFLKGWFKDTLPLLPAKPLSLIRLDGDMYESTMDALNNLYPKLSPGGFCIIDDYSLHGCHGAVSDYRDKYAITEPINDIDGMGAYWRKRQ